MSNLSMVWDQSIQSAFLCCNYGNNLIKCYVTRETLLSKLYEETYMYVCNIYKNIHTAAMSCDSYVTTSQIHLRLIISVFKKS